ncbi:hypothetical protein EML15_09805 [Corynebacterium sp. sy017]|uniref:suppressor of fused domain protein n=1 Tax=unclassified Corynebacterium TaxID=2624378 RepID=UPI0011859621|nr:MULTISPECIES: suppressor of fused domain protein [unclassified Corynebacterium]MBP3089432.1 hypothetical protein [Corynebacterium sp. sy017]TSD90882.1 hypothetical protein ELY17_08795 [Corynebacterium sp. SY003]
MDIAEVAQWYRNIIPAEIQLNAPVGNPQGFHIATAQLAEETLAATLNFNAVDTGLVAGDKSVRSELFALARAEMPTVASVVLAAADTFAQNIGTLTAQPGTMLTDLAQRASLPETISVRHGLCISPFVWQGQVPQYTEKHQLTALLQVVMLTQEEYEYATAYGVVELQKEMGKAQIDLNNWSR